MKERLTGRPLWYCVGDTEFYGYKIKVDERALIPRPETEELVEHALKTLDETKTVLDLCTGSGAIAVAIAKKSGAKVTASDISLKALELAEENAEMNGAELEFIKGDLFENLQGRKFDVIVTNPPYVKRGDIDKLQREIREFEPVLALDGGEAKEHINAGGYLFAECGEDQANDVASMFENAEIIKDINGKDRIVKAVF